MIKSNNDKQQPKIIIMPTTTTQITSERQRLTTELHSVFHTFVTQSLEERKKYLKIVTKKIRETANARVQPVADQENASTTTMTTKVILPPASTILAIRAVQIVSMYLQNVEEGVIEYVTGDDVLEAVEFLHSAFFYLEDDVIFTCLRVAAIDGGSSNEDQNSNSSKVALKGALRIQKNLIDVLAGILISFSHQDDPPEMNSCTIIDTDDANKKHTNQWYNNSNISILVFETIYLAITSGVYRSRRCISLLYSPQFFSDDLALAELMKPDTAGTICQYALEYILAHNDMS